MFKLIEFLFPPIQNYQANKKLKATLHPKNEKGEEIAPSGILCYIDNSDKLGIETLKEQYDETDRIKNKLEDKAKTNIIGITIAITLTMGASGILSAVSEKFQQPLFAWIVFVLLVVSVAYLLTAGLLVIQTLIAENEIAVVSLKNIADGGKALRDDYDKCIGLNRTRNVIRNNYIYTSYECIRNALICLFAILILVTIPLGEGQVNRHFSYVSTTADYTFSYSSDTIEYLKKENDLSSIEGSIVESIRDLASKQELETYGFLDSYDGLFIKYSVSGTRVTVLLIEPYFA